MAAKFEIRQPRAGQFQWVLLNQGRVLAKSDTYSRKAACLHAMESFRQAAPTAELIDHTPTRGKTASTPAPARAARSTGRFLGKAAAKVAEVPSLAVEAAKIVVGR